MYISPFSTPAKQNEPMADNAIIYNINELHNVIGTCMCQGNKVKCIHIRKYEYKTVDSFLK